MPQVPAVLFGKALDAYLTSHGFDLLHHQLDAELDFEVVIWVISLANPTRLTYKILFSIGKRVH